MIRAPSVVLKRRPNQTTYTQKSESGSFIALLSATELSSIFLFWLLLLFIKSNGKLNGTAALGSLSHDQIDKKSIKRT